jgi:hypothetical protein
MIETVYGEGGWLPDAPNQNIVEIIAGNDPDPAAVSAVTRWRSMGFSDDEIIAMAPALADAVTYDPN